MHSSSKWLKPAKYMYKLTWCVFTTFSTYLYNFRFRSLPTHHIENLSNRYRHKYDPSISRNFLSNFWRVFDVWPNYAVGGVLPCPWTPFSDRLFVQKVCELLMPKFPGRKITVIAFFFCLLSLLLENVWFLFLGENF